MKVKKTPSLKVTTSQTTKTKQTTNNPWLMHVSVVKLENPNIKYKDVLKLAKTTYTKKK